MNKQEIEQWLADNYPDEEFLLADGLEEAFMGVCFMFNNNAVVYDRNKCIDILKKDMTEKDAWEYFDFNISGAYVGEKTPVYIHNF